MGEPGSGLISLTESDTGSAASSLMAQRVQLAERRRQFGANLPVDLPVLEAVGAGIVKV